MTDATTTLSTRFAAPDDAERIHRIVEAAYRAKGEGAGWTTESGILDGQRTDLREISELIANPDGGLLTLREDDRIVATCQLERRSDHAYFGMFAVDPAAQAHGLGKYLLSEAGRVGREEWGLSQMRLTVIAARTDLIAWYERRGFRPTGATSPFPYGDERFGIPRVEGLHFVEFSMDL
ncbi:GNAT family N-acetyltransferase [Acidipropionibacterium acidipropionici]|uniref:GCN5 family acetyltransferase n=1 Tax=Acidipropionibacterium acidipropionici TaxID=1748 RepID=A0AAC9ANV1_9ACTN|nr:GNAT family N-acetyltransferase [Acidipropionibacterium acidipropionici]AMS06025.1 GCN5 family acetyltransferase [Acidipropionibacterium acidipropionici]AOZ47488.1 GCN5 family acetyltransferase [Acidipropionibacterium acidipropionici]